jgi:hypothetical protein
MYPCHGLHRERRVDNSHTLACIPADVGTRSAIQREHEPLFVTVPFPSNGPLSWVHNCCFEQVCKNICSYYNRCYTNKIWEHCIANSGNVRKENITIILETGVGRELVHNVPLDTFK